MNIEELNSCFDAMSPTKEQRDRIFAGIMSAKQQPVKIIKFHRYATAAAAVFVIGAFAAVYSNIGTNDVTNFDNKTTVAVENKVDSVNKSTVTEKVAETDAIETLPQIADTKTEKNSFTQSIAEMYPEVVGDSTENKKVAVENDVMETDNSTPEASAVETFEDIAPASAGGSGGASSAYRAVESESVSLEQIMNDEVYGIIFPTAIPDEFEFVSATKTDDDISAVFEDDNGKYMSVFVTTEFVEKVVEPEDIINLQPEYGFLNFAIKCGEYYIVYNVESEDASRVYEMVKSSVYFKN